MRYLPFRLLFCVATLAVASAAPAARAREQVPVRERQGGGMLDTPNGSGVLRTVTLDGQKLDLRNNPFFKSLGSNGRSCASCHVPAAGWTISPAEVQDRFKRTRGLDPIFRTNDGANAPT